MFHKDSTNDYVEKQAVDLGLHIWLLNLSKWGWNRQDKHNILQHIFTMLGFWANYIATSSRWFRKFLQMVGGALGFIPSKI